MLQKFIKALAYLFICLLVNCSTLNAQELNIDSLKQILKKTQHDTSKLTTLLLLSENTPDGEWEVYNQQLLLLAKTDLKKNDVNQKKYIKYVAGAYNNIGYSNLQIGQLDSALFYFKKAEAMFLSVNDKLGLANALSNMGSIYVQLGKMNEAFNVFLTCLQYQQALKDIQAQSYTLNNIAYIFQEQGNIKKALEYNFKSLKIREQANDKSGMAYSYLNIGSIYQNQGDLKLARDFYNKSYRLFQVLKNKKGVAFSLNNLGNLLLKENKLASALDYFTNGLKAAEQSGDRQSVALLLSGLGSVNEEMNDRAQADVYLNKCLLLYEEINDNLGIAETSLLIGQNLVARKDFQKALPYALEALKIAQTSGYIETLGKTTKLLYNIYKQNGNAVKALEMHELYVLYKDSVNNKENRKLLLRKEFEYEFEKKEASIKANSKIENEKLKLTASEDKKRLNIIIFSVLTGLLVIMVFSVFLWRNNKKVQAANIIITQQKQEVEIQKAKVEEHNKEVKESITYAQRIQKALLASTNLLNTHLNNYFVLYKPKDIVSGDFYWATYHNHKFYFIIADSTGHGVPGAFMSILNIGFLNEAIKEKELVHTNEILNYVRRRLIASLADDGSSEGGNDGMDCSLLCIDLKNKKLEYSCANNPIIILREGQAIELEADKMPVGRSPSENKSFTLNTFDLQSNDQLFAFTDGFIDQFGGPKGKKFKYKNFRDLLFIIEKNPSAQQEETLTTAFLNWKGDLEQVDDVLVIGIRV
jgi:serine phosphatase RsbU (regulator of sigma subunit)